MNRLAEHSSVCFIGNPFSVYFSTRCTAFTAAGGIKTLREYADQDRRPPPRRRQPGLANMPGHADDDARFHDRQEAYVHARGDSSDPPKTRIDYSWVQEERERLGGRVVINLT